MLWGPSLTTIAHLLVLSHDASLLSLFTAMLKCCTVVQGCQIPRSLHCHFNQKPRPLWDHSRPPNLLSRPLSLPHLGPKMVGHCILLRSERSVLFRSFKERNVLFLSFLSFWWLMKPKRTMRSFPFFSVLFFRMEKNAENVSFFCKECKRTQRTFRSFAKNGKEC